MNIEFFTSMLPQKNDIASFANADSHNNAVVYKKGDLKIGINTVNNPMRVIQHRIAVKQNKN